MARLITAQELQALASQAGAGRKYMLVEGLILTPGALDAARSLGVEILYPGPGTRSLIKRFAEEVSGEAVVGDDLKRLEDKVFTTIKSKGGN